MSNKCIGCFELNVSGNSCEGCRFLAEPLTRHGVYVCRVFLGDFENYRTAPQRCQKCFDAEKEYKRLKRAAAELEALERSGVDNWQWYEDAMANVEEILKE